VRPGAGVSEADVVGASVGASAGAAFGSSAGVSSTVLCLPVVQGGMVMNSSKVKTRGLQHFHPGEVCQLTVRTDGLEIESTFLALVEDWL
jgi:hypothetical protein